MTFESFGLYGHNTKKVSYIVSALPYRIKWILTTDREIHASSVRCKWLLRNNP